MTTASFEASQSGKKRKVGIQSNHPRWLRTIEIPEAKKAQNYNSGTTKKGDC
jgi:hypothetical protein